MADKKSTTTSSATRKTRATPKAATLYGYLNGYLRAHNIDENAPIGEVMDDLRGTIVAESQEV